MEDLHKKFKRIDESKDDYSDKNISKYAKLYTEEYINEIDFNKAEIKIKSLNIVGGDREKILLANGEPVPKNAVTVNEANHLAEGAEITSVGTADNCVPDLKWVRDRIDDNNKNYVDIEDNKKVNKAGDTMTGKLTVNNDIAIRNANISYNTSSGTLTITT